MEMGRADPPLSGISLDNSFANELELYRHWCRHARMARCTDHSCPLLGLPYNARVILFSVYSNRITLVCKRLLISHQTAAVSCFDASCWSTVSEFTISVRRLRLVIYLGV